MNVLWLLPPRPPGVLSGGDLYDASIVAGLRRLGHRVTVRSSPPGPESVRADVVVQDALGFAGFLSFNRALERLGHPARRVALVHVTTARLRPRAGTAPREAAYLASAHAAVFVSQQARGESLRLLARAAPGQRRPLRALLTEVIPPGADRLPVRPRRPGVPLRLLCVGHLMPQKGQLALLEAFAACTGLEATLVLAGEGTDRRYAAQVRARLRTVPRARWVGPLGPRGVARAFAEADVFINASQYESWGMAAAEAQAAGLPVLSWSEGGLWEFLTPGVDALRARKASVSALSRLGDQALLTRLRAGARRAAQHRRAWSTASHEFATFLERCAGR